MESTHWKVHNFIQYTLESTQFQDGKYTISYTLYIVFSSIYGNHDDSYCLIPFSFNPKIISLISPHPISLLIRNLLQKIHKSQFIEFSKKKQEIEDCIWPAKPYKGKIYFEPPCS